MTPTPRELEEYRALRATIRERGTARVYLFVLGLAVWAAATIATAALAALPVASLLPLLLLAASFEAVLSLHAGVERVGRYLEVYWEAPAGESLAPEASWERTVMRYGQRWGGGSDPLFTLYFLLATLVNFIPVLLAEPARIELIVVGAIHLVVIGRLLVARRAAGRQRTIDRDRFQQLRREGSS